MKSDFGRHKNSLLLSLLFLVFNAPCLSQSAANYYNIQIDTTDSGLPFLLLCMMGSVIIGVPILSYIYRVFLAKYVEKLSKRIVRLREKMNEKMSLAGKQLAEKQRVKV
jgi:hypothetical protein